jgi:sugar lactone lactonase YvrE
MFGSNELSGAKRARRISSTLVLSLLAAGLLALVGCGGGGGSGSGTGSTSGADPQRVYVVDQANDRIATFQNFSGLNRTNFGVSGSGVGQFSGANGIAVDTTSHIWVADSANNRVVRMDNTTGLNFRSFTVIPTTVPVTLGTVGGIAVDSFDHVLIADTTNGGIYRFDYDTTNNVLINAIRLVDTVTLGVNDPQNLYVDQNRFVYFTSGANGVIHRTNPLGGSHVSFDSGITTVGGIAVDATSRIYVSDPTNNRIIRFDDMTGANPVILGGTAAGTGVAQFNAPLGLAIDSSGRILVADTGNNRIVRFTDMLGTGWTTYGTVGTGPTNFTSPVAIALK